MNWKDDPEIQAEIRRRGTRNGLIRSTIIWMPLFVACAGATLFYLFDVLTGSNYGGTWVLVVILGILAVLFGFQAIQAAMDLTGPPEEESGFVERRWSRRDSLVMQTQYLRLGKRILRGDGDMLAAIKEGDYVDIRFYSHSAVIVWVEKQKAPPDAKLPNIRRKR
ncbi:MAG TPA: hypothetical protein VN697_10090 [Tepidiformaceae bacterium]|jgi:hypothetical protein|nr:hypothetical protein [Tepidiformaceae bacterium]